MREPAAAAVTKRVAVLLCTHNGERYLPSQLDSIAAQSHDDWQLWVSDDGSGDGTLAMLAAQRPRWHAGRLEIVAGPRRGSCANFLSLAARPEIVADYFAFADQDDVWETEKLARAVAWLAAQPADQAALYCGRTQLVDDNGRALGHSPLWRKPPAFANALVQNIAGGNTMVFNAAARRLIAQVDPAKLAVHDWWAYQVVSGTGGRVHYDPWPSLAYRQHGDNLIGSGRGLRAWLQRARATLQGRQKRWHDGHLAALADLGEQLTADNRKVLELFRRARQQRLPARVRGMLAAGIYRQTPAQNFWLAVGVLLDRV
jgi:glycosyltransferase involved in cell wall biosynthesis